jgi:hypothetical protein
LHIPQSCTVKLSFEKNPAKAVKQSSGLSTHHLIIKNFFLSGLFKILRNGFNSLSFSIASSILNDGTVSLSRATPDSYIT